ncbi:MAG TPA: type II toxin-antitoxin system HicA family toxin [Candidatus Ratteibacteria bacterium]|nr:type II toxin-antitoxin system HicA family toxin [bacterium]HRR96028.1 type II toxin-antitoxin system HicA family toxin [Candidatus Ratteibacteria bacterium]
MSILPIVKPKDVIRVAIKLGFVFDRQSGSHAVYYRKKDKRRVVIPIHSKDMKKKTLSGIIRDMGIKIEEFKKLL